jgi:mannose-6-phosphate isomerase-like protein (cupin superfamily)
MVNDKKYGRQSVPQPSPILDYTEKYWGSITTAVKQDGVVLKKIVMNKNTQSSMEYHVFKDEIYYVISGKLKVGMRVGRAENKSVIVNAGETIIIPKGLMHMRIALEDTIIIEYSNVDDDSDSNIVEDGKNYQFKESE